MPGRYPVDIFFFRSVVIGRSKNEIGRTGCHRRNGSVKREFLLPVVGSDGFFRGILRDTTRAGFKCVVSGREPADAGKNRVKQATRQIRSWARHDVPVQRFKFHPHGLQVILANRAASKGAFVSREPWR